MEGEVLTTWGVVLDVNGTDDAGRLESIGGWFAEARAAFFARCPRLAELLRSEDAILVVIAEEVGPIAFPTSAGALIGVSVVEIRRTSFDMALRIRPVGDGGRPANGRCTIVIEECATGARMLVPRDIRDEFVALQLAARGLC